MKTRIEFFLKFFEEEQYARAFVAGRMYLNPLAFFKGLEQNADDGRGDRHEAPLAWHQPAKLGLIQLAGVRIEPADLAGPVIIQGRDADALNVLCLYAATRGTFEKVSAENVEAFREHLRVPERCQRMGRFVVLVHRVNDFIKRFVAAAKRNRFSVQGKLVDYFDPDVFSGNVEHPAFAKRQKFAWQREYRLVLDRNVSKPAPYVLDMGPLSDLCTIVDAARLNETPTVILPE